MSSTEPCTVMLLFVPTCRSMSDLSMRVVRMSQLQHSLSPREDHGGSAFRRISPSLTMTGSTLDSKTPSARNSRLFAADVPEEMICTVLIMLPQHELVYQTGSAPCNTVTCSNNAAEHSGRCFILLALQGSRVAASRFSVHEMVQV